MTPEEFDRVSTLCREIQVELDPARFLILIEEFTDLLTQGEMKVGLNYAVSNH